MGPRFSPTRIYAECSATSDCTKASPPRRSTQHRFLNVRRRGSRMGGTLTARSGTLIGQFHVCKGIDPMDPILDFFNERPRDNWKWQFMPDAAGHNAVNAVALANLALLAYSGTEGVRHFLVDNWTFSDLQPLAGESTQGFVARKEDLVFVAFRGTQPTSILDWWTDGKYH